MPLTISLRRGGFFLSIFAAGVAGPFACSGPADLRSLDDPKPKTVHHDAGKDAGKKKDAGKVDSGFYTPDEACTDYATIICAKLDECTQGIATVATYDTHDECIERESITCLASLSAPDNASTPAGTERCGAAIALETCNDFYDHTNTPSACTARPGPRANGSPCGFNGQCASAWCYASPSSACGVCTTRPDAGAPCEASAVCGGQGLHCAPNGTCEPVTTYGASCNPNTVCPYESQCVGPSSAADAGGTGTCTKEGAEAGAACDSTLTTAALCSEGSGYFCPSATNQCASTPYVTVNVKCGVTAGMRLLDAGPDARGPSSLTRCGAGDICIAQTAGSKTETCMAPVPEGMACDTVLGPPCLSPARCVLNGDSDAADASTAGICNILGVTSQCN